MKKDGINIEIISDKALKLLNANRLPARLTAAQVGVLLGFCEHEISILVRSKFLTPLGNPAQNGHKFFFRSEILLLSEDRAWLDKATKAVTRHWKDRNQKLLAQKAA